MPHELALHIFLILPQPWGDMNRERHKLLIPTGPNAKLTMATIHGGRATASRCGVGGVEEEERVDTAFEAGVAVRNEARLEGHL